MLIYLGRALPCLAGAFTFTFTSTFTWCIPREARQNPPCCYVNMLVHLNVNVPEMKRSRFPGTLTFTSTFTWQIAGVYL